MLRYLSHAYDKHVIFASEPMKELTNDEKLTILTENHNDITGHLGIQKTYKRILERHNWPNLLKDVEEFVKQCEICQQEKLTRIRGKEQAVIPDTPIDPNDKISMDIFGPLTKTKRGNQFILSIQDQLTKYLVLVPLKDQQAQSIIDQLLEHYIYIFSAPRTILTDQGTNFVSKLMETFEQAFKIKHIKTTSFHPQSNGSIERTHATIKDLLKTCMTDRQTEWDENLKLICMGYNTAVHETTGHTPFELTFGRNANMPSAIATTHNTTYKELVTLWKKRHQNYLENAHKIIQRNKERYARDQNRKILKTQTIFKLHDNVLIHNDHKTHKLDHVWLGPYTIEEMHALLQN